MKEPLPKLNCLCFLPAGNRGELRYVGLHRSRELIQSYFALIEAPPDLGRD